MLYTLSPTIRCTVATLALACALQSQPAVAQSYPTRAITIVVPLVSGTGMDSLVRIYGDKLSHSLGQPIVVLNKPGAALMLGAAYVASSPPDGYTLGVTTTSVMSYNPVLYKKIEYDPNKFEPISLYVKSPFVLVVGPGVPAKSAPDLIKLAKESKQPLTYASTGTGTLLHLAGAYMANRFGLKMTHVPYRSTGQSLTDVMTGRVTFSFAEAGASIPLIKAGKLRALAVSSPSRLPRLPDVPTFAEAVKEAPDFEVVAWHLLVAPGGTPQSILTRLRTEMRKIMTMPDVRTKITHIGLIPVDMPVDDIKKFVASERQKWSTVVNDLGLAGSR